MGTEPFAAGAGADDAAGTGERLSPPISSAPNGGLSALPREPVPMAQRVRANGSVPAAEGAPSYDQP